MTLARADPSPLITLSFSLIFSCKPKIQRRQQRWEKTFGRVHILSESSDNIIPLYNLFSPSGWKSISYNPQERPKGRRGTLGFLCDLLRVSLRKSLLPYTILVCLTLTFRSCCHCHCLCVRHVCVDVKMSVLVWLNQTVP